MDYLCSYNSSLNISLVLISILLFYFVIVIPITFLLIESSQKLANLFFLYSYWKYFLFLYSISWIWFLPLIPTPLHSLPIWIHLSSVSHLKANEISRVKNEIKFNSIKQKLMHWNRTHKAKKEKEPKKRHTKQILVQRLTFLHTQEYHRNKKLGAIIRMQRTCRVKKEKNK